MGVGVGVEIDWGVVMMTVAVRPVTSGWEGGGRKKHGESDRMMKVNGQVRICLNSPLQLTRSLPLKHNDS